jgi:hypothetical protein
VGITLVIMQLLFILVTLVTLMADGWLFFYQAILTYMYTFIYLRVCLLLDSDIQKLVLKIGFEKKSSRTKKFELLFFVIGAVIIASVFNASSSPIWEHDRNIMDNIVNQYKRVCADYPINFGMFGKGGTFE